MKNLILALVLTVKFNYSLATLSSFIDVPVFVQEIKQNGAVVNQFIDILHKNQSIEQYEPRSTPLTAMRFYGMCIQLNSQDCARSDFTFDLMKSFAATTNGRKEPEIKYLPEIMNFEIKSVTKIISETEDLLTVEVKTIYLASGASVESIFKLSLLPEFVGIKHEFSFPDKDEPNRKKIEDVGFKLKTLSSGVMMLQTDINTADMVAPGGRSHGTGFFLSNDGLMMTNHHVIDSFSNCKSDFSCEVNFSQIKPDGQRIEFRTKIAILAMSSLYDFALIKVIVPSNIQFLKFDIETNKVGPDLVTLGFPGDIYSQDQKTPLTYSFGKLVGFHGQTYSTSNYIFSGASGSPLLSADTYKLVALLSNGVGTMIPGVGAPGLARPIYLIDSEFGISGYLTGEKQFRIKRLIRQIRDAQTSQEALSALDAYRNEKTFYGLSVLKLLMINHSEKSVRTEIARCLQKMSILTGAKI